MKDKTLTLPLKSCLISGRLPTPSVPWIPRYFEFILGDLGKSETHKLAGVMFSQTASGHYWKMGEGNFFNAEPKVSNIFGILCG